MKRKNDIQEVIEKTEKKLTNLVTRKKNKKKIIISTAFAITGAAVIVTPIIIYKKENSAYEVLIESSNTNFQSYAMTLTKGATITNLKSKLVKMEGHILTGVYKDEACTIKYEDTEKVTKNSVVYLKYEKLTYSVSLPSSENFKILYSTSVDINKIEWGDTFTFQVLLEEPYSLSDIEVIVDDETLTPDKNGFYQISFVDNDFLVKINGVEINTYSIANLPSQVTVVNSKGKILTKKDTIEYGESVTVSFNETVGYDVSKFAVNGKEIISGETIVVTENLNIVYQEVKTYFKLTLPEIEGVTYEYSNADLNNFWTHDTFNFKVHLDEAYSNSFLVLSANDTVIYPDNNGEYTLTFFDENINVDIQGVEITTFEITSLPSQIVITDSGNNRYSEGDYIVYGTAVTVTYEESVGHAMTSFEVNGEEVENHSVDLIVKDGFSISYEETDVSYLSFSEEENYISVVGYDGTVAEVIIPKTYHKKPVQVIAEYTFNSNADNITSIILPNTIKQIEKFAFQGCNGITSLYLPASVEVIGEYAFANTAIEEVTIAEGSELTILESDAFSSLSQSANNKLKSINLEVATKLTNIGSGAFGYTEIEEIIIPESVTKLGKHAFYFSRLKSIRIPASVQLIDDYCFAGCDNLTQLEIAENSSLEYIGIEAFKSSELSGEIVLPKNLTSLGLDAFSGTQITKFSLEEGGVLSSIGEYALASNKLQTLDLRNTNSLTTINNAIFVQSNSLLEEVFLPASLISLGKEVFKECTKLTTVEFAENSVLETIGDSAFGNCTALTQITIPASVKTIEIHAFYYCFALETVYIEAGSNLESIGEEAFEGDPIKYLNLEVATKLRTISRYAFRSTKLTYVAIPASVISIGEAAFNINTLETVVFAPSSQLKTIEKMAFYECALTNITIPASVTSIGEECFKNNSQSLTVYIEYGSNLTTIGKRAFTYSSLNSINLEFATQLKNIEIGAFYGNSLTSIELPVSITTIGETAFADCWYLDTVIIPVGSQLETLETGAFGFAGITSINLENAVTLKIIGSQAFYNTKITSIKLPESVETIGSEAFASSRLISITVPENVSTIADEVFVRSDDLTEIIITNSYVYQNLSQADIELVFNNGGTIKVLKEVETATPIGNAYLIPDNCDIYPEGEYIVFKKLSS